MQIAKTGIRALRKYRDGEALSNDELRCGLAVLRILVETGRELDWRLLNHVATQYMVAFERFVDVRKSYRERGTDGRWTGGNKI